jgi:hypothetical protein
LLDFGRWNVYPEYSLNPAILEEPEEQGAHKGDEKYGKQPGMVAEPLRMGGLDDRQYD